MSDVSPPGVLVGIIHLSVSESHTADQCLDPDSDLRVYFGVPNRVGQDERQLMAGSSDSASQRSTRWTRGGRAQSWCSISNGGRNGFPLRVRWRTLESTDYSSRVGRLWTRS